jgi:hypothetical protein
MRSGTKFNRHEARYAVLFRATRLFDATAWQAASKAAGEMPIWRVSAAQYFKEGQH